MVAKFYDNAKNYRQMQQIINNDRVVIVDNITSKTLTLQPKS